MTERIEQSSDEVEETNGPFYFGPLNARERVVVEQEMRGLYKSGFSEDGYANEFVPDEWDNPPVRGSVMYYEKKFLTKQQIEEDAVDQLRATSKREAEHDEVP